MGQSMIGCPNVTPGTDCVDPDCTYCRIARAEGGALRRPVKLIKWPEQVQEGHGQHVHHWCPGCERLHVLPDGWTRTGPDEAPTYTPSFLQHERRGPCHYIITDGVLNYCPDSWHTLRGAVPMPDIPERVIAHLTEEVFKT